MKQKKIESISHEINVDVILKCLWAIRDNDQFYFNAYGKEMIENCIKQRIAKQKKMENNLELHKQITFDELVKHGFKNGANVNNRMPWSWKINGKSVTHENDKCYIIETMDGNKRFEHPDKLIAYASGLIIMTNSINDHAPGGCPM